MSIPIPAPTGNDNFQLIDIAAPTPSAKAQQDKAIEAAFGLLKGKNILPLDALQFEREMRDAFHATLKR